MIKKLLKQQIPSTYQVGLLLARTHRILKVYTDTVLIPYDITSVDWALLGLLHDRVTEPMRLSDLATELGVEASFVTVRVNRLAKRDLLILSKNSDDKRVRLACITPAGSTLVNTIEPILRSASRSWLKNIGHLDIYSFVKVMRIIVRDADKNQVLPK